MGETELSCLYDTRIFTDEIATRKVGCDFMIRVWDGTYEVMNFLFVRLQVDTV
jgi:hypothetical protein